MPIPQAIRPDSDPCVLADHWGIASELAFKLVALAQGLPFGIRIISGYRSPEKQRDLLARPDSMAAPVDRSTHTTCPATGADLWTSVHPADQIKWEFGRVARLVGLRWGGGSRLDPQTNIPVDWNHVDLGPRSSPP